MHRHESIDGGDEALISAESDGYHSSRNNDSDHHTKREFHDLESSDTDHPTGAVVVPERRCDDRRD